MWKDLTKNISQINIPDHGYPDHYIFLILRIIITHVENSVENVITNLIARFDKLERKMDEMFEN